MKLLLQLWKHVPFGKPIRAFMLRQINDEFLVGVTGVIFNKKNHILILKHTYRKTAWSLPGGYLQAKEHPREGLAREIKEETGFKVEVLKFLKSRTNRHGRLDLCYVGRYKSGTFKASEEVSNFRFVTLNNLPKLINDQYDQITQGLEMKKELDFEKRLDAVKNFVPNLFKRITH